MIYMFRDKLYKGTRVEIEDQLYIDLRDLLGWQFADIHKELKNIPETYNFEIGIDIFSGTKKEILEQFIRAQKIAPIVCTRSCTLKLLGIPVILNGGEHTCAARTKVIDVVKGMIDDI